MTLLEVEGIDVGYGAVRALAGVSLVVDAGRDRRADRRQRRREDHALAHDQRPRAAGGRHDRIRRRATSRGSQPDRIVRLGIAHAPEGRARVRADVGRENLELGAYAERRAESQRRHSSAC